MATRLRSSDHEGIGTSHARDGGEDEVKRGRTGGRLRLKAELLASSDQHKRAIRLGRAGRHEGGGGGSGVGGVDASTAGAMREGEVQARSEYRRRCGDGKVGREQPSELYTTDETGRSTSRAECMHETVWASVRDSRHEPNVLETSRPTSGVSERATALDLCMSGLLRRNIQFNSIQYYTN